MSGAVVLDASAWVDLALGRPDASWVRGQLALASIAVPAHARAEVFSALGRHFRAGTLDSRGTEQALDAVTGLRCAEHSVAELIMGAWRRRDNLGLADALYVELASQLDTMVITTDRRLARATPLAVAPPE